MNNYKVRVSVADALFCISMAFVAGFPNPSIYKAISIIAFFAYTVGVSVFTGRSTKNTLQYVGWFSFFAFCNLSKWWSVYPSAADDVLSNVLWSLMISIAIVNYITIYKLSVIDVSNRILVVALIYFACVILNGKYIDGRYTVVIDGYMLNENMFGQIALGFAAYMLYWVKQKKGKSMLVNMVLAALVVLSLLSGSRKSLVSLVVYILLFALCEYPPKSISKLLIKIVGYGILIFGAYACIMSIDSLYSSIGVRRDSLFDFLSGNTDSDGSLSVRLLMSREAIKMFWQKPFFGHGVNAFAYVSGFEAYAHNNYLELLANVGVIGCVIYYIPIIRYFSKAFRCWKHKYKHSIVPLAVIGVYIANDFAMVSYASMPTQAFLAIAIGLCINIYSENSKLHEN